jgi:protein gp37
MELIDRHIYQVLTKRPERMRRYLKRRYRSRAMPAHIWIGTSVESNEFAWRAEMLIDIPAQVRFLSVEPMLGPVDKIPLDGISWVIVGGESGPGKRLMQIDWIRQMRDRCNKKKIAFFFKQWHKGNTGRMLDNRTWDEMPEYSSATA